MKFKQDKREMALMIAQVLIEHTKFLLHALKEKLYPNISESLVQRFEFSLLGGWSDNQGVFVVRMEKQYLVPFSF